MNEALEPIRTILIVDDVQENVSLLETILSGEYITRVATRGSEALKVACETPPDLILLDIMMPEMNGYDVCKILKENPITRRIPVIFVTALLNPGDEVHGFEAGGVDYLTKPVIASVVRIRVKAHLALKEAQDELEQWNRNLGKRLLKGITTIRTKTEALMSAEEKAVGLHGYMQSVELLSGVFELMEDRFCVRSRTVSELAGDAARRMNLPAEDVAKIRLAGLLHDIGTLSTRRVISEKSESEMTVSELEGFHAHPAQGQKLFEALEYLQDVGQMVRGHHEAYDGSGFPDGLKGDEIPIGARLIAIARVIERAASSVSGECAEYAIMMARQRAGTLLDPRLISYFIMITRLLYFKKETSGAPGEVAIPPDDLVTGMQFSRDLSSEAGILLFQKGSTLDTTGITLIRRISRMNRSPERKVWVYVNSEE